ncbi:MAG: ATP-binding protein [Treponema sp.]|jgi:hypothetical protein|nr:ATP-binding protein [Treponema sp.]
MKLPIGIQTFSDIREQGYLYVDKTREIHRLISAGKVFFLSRPRRFGKSLLISTLEAIFKGKKALFEGLYIEDKIDWNERYPVITLDWSSISHTSAGQMEEGTAIYLSNIAAFHDITLNQKSATNRFEELLTALHQKTGRQAVVLVDEYDMPILDALGKPDEITDEIRQFLQSFYKVLKAADRHLRFVFLTGVSKFSKVSIFSGLNNLNDITLDADYAALCGYTQDELERYFDSAIDEMALAQRRSRQDLLERIRYWYNGFSWDGVTLVYNPFSTLLLFSKKVFRDYWFETGTPTFLINIIKERNDVKVLLEPVEIKDSNFEIFDYRTLDTKILLFQTGYLTVKQVIKDRFGEKLIYTLGVPNEEVRSAMLEYLTSSFAAYPVSDTAIMRERMMGQLFDGDVSGLERGMQALFAEIPSQLHLPWEAYYHSLLLLWLNMLGFEVQAEVSTDKGRIDAVWTWEERVVIAEVKYAIKGKVEPLLKKAMAQIMDRRYYERYNGAKRRIALLAIGFAGKNLACRMTEL